MNFITLLAVLLIAVISTTDAFWGARGFGWGGLGGWGGFGGWGGQGYGGWGGQGYGGWGGLGYGYGYPGFIGKRLAEERRVECLLATKTSINCNSGKIICDVVPMLDDLAVKFDMFGIELVNGTYLSLYPRTFTENTFKSNIVPLVNGSMVNLVLAPIGNLGTRGIMVRELTCFKSLIELFKSIPVVKSSERFISGFIL